jgi:hypothetical protein
MDTTYSLINLMVNGKPIQIPVEPHAYQHYLKKYPGRGGLAGLLNELIAPCNNFLAIASEFSLSRERIRQLYMKYLSEHLSLKTGFERVSYCTLARSHIKEWPPETLKVWKEARKHGLPVQYVNYRTTRKDVEKGHVVTRRRTLRIRGYDCAVRYTELSFATKKGSVKYYRFTVFPSQIKKADFFILSVPDNFFPIPSSFLQMIADTGINRPTVYIPENFKREFYNHITAKWDVLPYRNNWDQLWK